MGGGGGGVHRELVEQPFPKSGVIKTQSQIFILIEIQETVMYFF